MAANCCKTAVRYGAVHHQARQSIALLSTNIECIFSFWAAAQQHELLLVRGCRPEMNDTQLAITVGPGCLARLNLVDRSAKVGGTWVHMYSVHPETTGLCVCSNLRGRYPPRSLIDVSFLARWLLDRSVGFQDLDLKLSWPGPGSGFGSGQGDSTTTSGRWLGIILFLCWDLLREFGKHQLDAKANYC